MYNSFVFQCILKIDIFQKLMKTVDVNSLPDRGNKIRDQIKDLTAEIQEIDKALKVMKVSDVKGTVDLLDLILENEQNSRLSHC